MESRCTFGFDYESVLDQKCASCGRIPNQARIVECCKAVYYLEFIEKIRSKSPAKCPNCGESKLWKFKGQINTTLEQRLRVLKVKCRESFCVWVGLLTKVEGHRHQWAESLATPEVANDSEETKLTSAATKSAGHTTSGDNTKGTLSVNDNPNFRSQPTQPDQKFSIKASEDSATAPSPAATSKPDFTSTLEEDKQDKTSCSFAFAGCTKNFSNLQIHLEEDIGNHMCMLAQRCEKALQDIENLDKENFVLRKENEKLKRDYDAQSQELQHLKAENEELRKVQEEVQGLDKLLRESEKRWENIPLIPPVTLTMTNYSKFHSAKCEWISPCFYSEFGGCKMCIQVNCSGLHLAVKVVLMEEGWKDRKFKLTAAEIKLLDQRDANHYKKRLELTSPDIQRSNTPTDSGTLSCSRFIATADLECNPEKGHQYLMDDCLRFRILEVKID